MKLSIIIPTKDRGEIFNHTLACAYEAISTFEAEIIIVNDSKTNPVLIDPRKKDKITGVDNPKSGVASARNYGASYAKGKILLFLDDDMLVNESNIQDTLALHQKYCDCCINLNWIYPPALSENMAKNQFGRYLIHYGFTSLKGWNRGEVWDDKNLFQTNGITSQYLSMDRSVFQDSGGYNESFPHAGFEDFDFAQRLKQQYIQFYIYPLSMVFHNETDRIHLKAWLARKKRGGETRRVALEMGYTQVSIKYGVLKCIALQGLVKIQALLLLLLKLIPNVAYLDFLYFKIVNILLATAIFEGYDYKKSRKS